MPSKLTRSAASPDCLRDRHSRVRLRPQQDQVATPPTSPATSTRSTRSPSSAWTGQRYDEAAKLFDEVERQHPYSVWARRAQLMSAFSYYMAQKYPEAISSAQRFLTIHPGNKDAPYAHYLIAMSYYQQIEDVTRDQAITQQASDAFGELIRRYPRQPLRGRRAAEARPHQRPSRRQGDGGRPLLSAVGQVAGGDAPVPQGGRQISDHQPHARSAGAAGRMLSRARHSAGSAEGGRGARRQLSGQRMVPAQPTSSIQRHVPQTAPQG